MPRALVAASLACTGLAASAACDAGTAPAYVTLGMRGNFPADGVLSTFDGATLRLDSAHLTVLTAALERCAPGATAGLGALFLPGTAHAHGPGLSTQIDEPHIVDLRSPRGSWLGGFEPPTGRYCGVRLTLGPAASYAEGLPSDDFAGKTFAITGSVDRPTARSVAGRSTGSLTTVAPLTPALELAEGDSVGIGLALGDADAFATTAIATLSDDALAGTLLFNAYRTITVTVGR